MGDIASTKKLYLEDSYTVSFQATLLSCQTLDDGRIAAILDQTCFYPESGGQLADRGVIEDVDVGDVWEDESEIVYHELTATLPPGPVRCRADWDRRFDHMQQHTGQHVLSRAFIEIAGLDTASFHMGAEGCTIDLESGELTDEAIDEAEALANAVIWQDRDVIVKTVGPSELKDTDLRKKLPDNVAEVRLVEVDKFDVCGCCGTHVRRTGELGAIKVLKHEKVRDSYRVSFKVGQRAFRDFRDKHDIVKTLANRFTTSVEGVADKVEKLQAEVQRYRKDMKKLSKKLAGLEAGSLLEAAEVHGDWRVIARVFSDYDDNYIRALSSALKTAKGTINIMGSAAGMVVCNASADVQIDLSNWVIEYAESLGGSGGGKGGFATVQLPKGASVEEFVARVVDKVKQAG
jgi:alanyl-tRNA synthetase